MTEVNVYDRNIYEPITAAAEYVTVGLSVYSK